MKIILLTFVVLLFFGCSNVQTVQKKLPLINLIVQQDKYSLILKHDFYKNFENYNEKFGKINVKINLSFNSTSTLSNNGNDNLTIINGKVDFEIHDTLNKIIIDSGSIRSSINTGSISSLYGVDQNNNFAKERISKYLAYKLYRKILLNFSRSET